MRIYGPKRPEIGKKTEYQLDIKNNDTPFQEDEEPLFELFMKRKNGKFMKLILLKTGIGEYIFGQPAVDETFKVVAYNSKSKRKLAEFDLSPQKGNEQKIVSVKLRHKNNSEPEVFSMLDKMEVVAQTVNLQKRTLIFELYQGEKNENNIPLATQEGIVLANGISTVEFDLAKILMKENMKDVNAPDECGFYVDVKRKPSESTESTHKTEIHSSTVNS